MKILKLHLSVIKLVCLRIALSDEWQKPQKYKNRTNEHITSTNMDGIIPFLILANKCYGSQILCISCDLIWMYLLFYETFDTSLCIVTIFAHSEFSVIWRLCVWPVQVSDNLVSPNFKVSKTLDSHPRTPKRSLSH